MQKYPLFIISGPSGAGEDSIIDGLTQKLPIERVITTTTRQPRPGESQGKPYYFVSSGEFRQKIDSREFVEYAQEYNNHYYGVTKKELERVRNSGKIGIWKIEYKGVIFVKKNWPEIKSILIMTENLRVLEKRIRLRDNADEAYIQERMDYTREWLAHEHIYDYKVINRENQLDTAIKEVVSIISKEIEEYARST